MKEDVINKLIEEHNETINKILDDLKLSTDSEVTKWIELTDT